MISCGEVDRFAFEFDFHPDPDDGACATPEEASSWGSFRIWANGSNLCLGRDSEQEFESINWYLLPLFEWLANHWDARFREESPHPRTDEEYYEWWTKHCLLACAEGGLFPDVTFKWIGDLIEVSWEPTRLAGQPDEYHFLCGEGIATFRPEVIMKVFREALEESIEFLVDRNPKSERIALLSEKIRSIKSTKIS